MAIKVDAYEKRLSGWKRETFALLRKAIVAASPEIVEAFKWGQPVFEAGGPVCYLKSNNKHVTFGFWRGVELMALDERFETSGMKMAHIKFHEGDIVGAAKVRQLVKAAVALNAEKGNPTRGGSN